MIFYWKYKQKKIEVECLTKECFSLLQEKINTEQSLKDLYQKYLILHKKYRRVMDKKLKLNDSTGWENKWKKSTVYYSAPKKKKVVCYLTYREIKLISNIADELLLKIKCNDDVPIVVLKWLNNKFKKKNFKYKSENKERWNTPEETLIKKQGDCDDWAILEYYIIRELFVKLKNWKSVKHRLKIVVGHMHYTNKMNSYAGCHCYLVWLKKDCNFYTIESTFCRNKAITNYNKLAHKYNSQYGLIVFTFNQDFSWNQKSITISRGDING